MENGKSLASVTGVQTGSTMLPPISGTNPKWFYGSGLDLVVGCGAWSIPLLLLAYYSTASYPQAVAIGFYALALVFNYPHYMATIYRAYRTREDFAKYKIFTVHLSLLIALLLVLGHFSSQLLAFVFSLYLTWSPFHYTGQNFGIALLFARRNGVNTTLSTRRAFYLAFLSSYAMFFLAFHSFPASDDFSLTLGIPPKIAAGLWIGMLGIFLASAIYSLSAFVKQTSLRAMTAPLVMLSTQIVWFVVPTGLTLFSDPDFLQAPAMVAILAVMHSVQYLWITSYYARREAQQRSSSANAVTEESGNWQFVSYFFILIIGGIALFIPGPWLASRILHLDYGTSFLVFTALVNLHHFILDGAIWKLRDGRIASLLLNLQKSDNAKNLEFGFNRLTGWLNSSRGSARLFKVAAALGLLLLAGIDQIKFYNSARGSDLASLQFAQQLNPYDASLQLKLARSGENGGNQAAARAALEEAVRINPNYRQAQDSLAKLLIETGKYDEAYAHYERMFARLAPDVNSLVNFGILAAQLDHREEATKAWRQALVLDPKQTNAHFYLAEALAKNKEFKDATIHYEQYLMLAANDAKAPGTTVSSSSRPNPYKILRAALQLAVCYQNTGDKDKALSIFTKAVALAEKAEDSPSLKFALVRLAEIKAERNQLPAALADFQRALLLDKTGDSFGGGNASGWFRYGKLLQKAAAAPRLFAACFIKSAALLEINQNASGDDEIQNLSEMLDAELKDSESALDAAGLKQIKDHLDSVLQEALILKL